MLHIQRIESPGQFAELFSRRTPRISRLLQKEVVKMLSRRIKGGETLYLRSTNIRANSTPRSKDPVLTRLIVRPQHLKPNQES